MTNQAPAFTAWLDDFFASYYRNRPVNATFTGIHSYDSTLPDFSARGTAATQAEMVSLLERLQQLPAEELSFAQATDRRLAKGFLHIQLWEYQSNHFQRGNPCVYTGEAVFSILALFLTDFAPLSERVKVAIERMNAIPVLLEQGQTNLLHAPSAWVDRAVRECDGAWAFFGVGCDQLMKDEGIQNAEFRKAADTAGAAFARFKDFLMNDLQPATVENYGCGEEAFTLMLREGHCIEMSPDEIVRYAEEQIAQAEAYLAVHAPDFGSLDWRTALAGLAELHPTVEDYYARYTDLWQACKTAAENSDLLTWPDFPIEYVPVPAWARQAAPYLYFLPYRAPAAFNRPPVHRYLVTPIDASLSHADQQKRLRSVNDSVIKLNHVVHHGSIGHHVQNYRAYQAESRIGQVAAIDCAARIGMFCGGTMAEGWACYTTDLIGETGYLTPLEQYSEMQSRLRMASRAIVDVRLHQGVFSLAEAAAFYERHAGMPPEAALGEAVKNSMFPGAAVIYLLGTDGIRNLRNELTHRLGSRFSLRAFHDRFLSYGSIPVTLICEDMLSHATDAE